MGFTMGIVIIFFTATLRITEGRPLIPDNREGTIVFSSAMSITRHREALTHQADRPVLARKNRDVTALDDLPRHHRGYLSQPPLPVDDGNNEQSMCEWRYEDNVSSSRFPSTLKVAVKVHTGSRCRDPATGAPRADLVCLPIDYELNVLRKDSEGVWQQSVEYVTIGFTCAGSGVR